MYFGSEGPLGFIWKEVAWCEIKLMSESLITLVKQVVGLFGILRYITLCSCRSQCPRGLRRRSVAARLLGLWVRIPSGAWISLYCECCVFSGRGLCDELVTRPEESYRLWCVVECDIENLVNEVALAHWGAVVPKKNFLFVLI